MRRLFPASILVGWKYELAGTREEALAKARKQIEENHIDGCVVNGAAYGSGFGFFRPPTAIRECENKTKLVQHLTEWL